MQRFPMFNNKDVYMHLGKEIGVMVKPSVDEIFAKDNKFNGRE